MKILNGRLLKLNRINKTSRARLGDLINALKKFDPDWNISINKCMRFKFNSLRFIEVEPHGTGSCIYTFTVGGSDLRFKVKAELDREMSTWDILDVEVVGQ